MAGRRVASWVSAVVLMAACGGDSGGSNGAQQPDVTPGSGTGWTVLVYMAADNDLEPFALDDLAEMVSAGSGEGLRIVVQVDRHPGYSRDAVPGLGDFADARRVVVKDGGVEQIEAIGEPNMGDPATLADFIAWGVARYPAARYALVLWDHGASWLGFGVDESSKTESGKNDLLRLDELEQGIRDGLSRSGLKRLDLLGFDACLMSSWEVARTLRPHSRFLVASEELVPGHGWDYAALSAARVNPQLAADALGIEVIDGFWQQSIERGTSQQATMALVDLDRLGTLEGAMGQLEPLAVTTGAIGRQRHLASEYGRQPDPSDSMNLVDIGSLFEGLDRPEFATVRAEMIRGLGEAVVYERNGTSDPSASGMSVYFPPDAKAYERKQAQYARYDQASSWRRFLEAYLGAAATAPPPRFVSAEAIVAQTSPELVFGGLLAPGSLDAVVSATLDVGLPAFDEAGIPVGWWLFGEFPASYGTTTGGDDVAAASWDYQVPTLTQGSTSDFGYILVEEQHGGAVSATIPFAYLEGPDDAEPETALWVITLGETGELQANVMYLIDSTGAMGELAAAPGSLLLPVVQLVSTDWSRASFVIDPAGTPLDATNGITLDFVSIAPFTDTYYAALWITNAAGIGDRLDVVGSPP